MDGKKEKLVQRIHELCTPDHGGDSLRSGAHRDGGTRHGSLQAAFPRRLFNALMKAGVNVRLIDQGSSELNIIVGVAILDFEVATRAMHRAFCHPRKPLVRTAITEKD